jgi:hypothetical protein
MPLCVGSRYRDPKRDAVGDEFVLWFIRRVQRGLRDDGKRSCRALYYLQSRVVVDWPR